VIALAEQDARLRHALFGAVSGHEMYRAIVRELLDPRWLARMALRLAALPFRSRNRSRPVGTTLHKLPR
jgi:hypothetical protein